MRRVVTESPFAGDVDRNRRYLRAAMLDCFQRGEAPFASHGLYTDVLDDNVPAAREQGIAAGLAWGSGADATVVYYDLGVSPGMRAGISHAAECGRKVEWRSLEAWAKQEAEAEQAIDDRARVEVGRLTYELREAQKEMETLRAERTKLSGHNAEMARALREDVDKLATEQWGAEKRQMEAEVARLQVLVRQHDHRAQELSRELALAVEARMADTASLRTLLVQTKAEVTRLTDELHSERSKSAHAARAEAEVARLAAELHDLEKTAGSAQAEALHVERAKAAGPLTGVDACTLSEIGA